MSIILEAKDIPADLLEYFEPIINGKPDVFKVTTQSYSGAHFATFPEALVMPCVLAGSRPGDVVIDPFCGSGTVGVVCRKTGRKFAGVDLNMEYLRQAQVRVENKEATVKTVGLPLFEAVSV